MLMLAGCAPAAGGEGPLDYSDAGNWTLCTPGARHTHMLFATSVPLRTGAAITIESVEPVDASNLEVLSNSVIFLTGDIEMSVEDLPPSSQFAADWADRVPAEGAEFGSDDHVQLVTEVRAVAGEDAALRALDVTYTTAGGGRYTVTTNGSLRVASSTC
jgi:hypothetical protein